MISRGSVDYDLDGLASMMGKYSCDYISTEELKETFLFISTGDMP
ncbi:MAG: hypothetical protein QXZ17_11010 [Nitrososphaerota archaeon]